MGYRHDSGLAGTVILGKSTYIVYVFAGFSVRDTATATSKSHSSH